MGRYLTLVYSHLSKERRDETVSGEKQIFVSIYCKIYTDSFSDEMVNRIAAGAEIFNFLMKDAGLSFDEQDHLIPGDLNLWYLGCNEKFGCLRVKDKILDWDFGESSFDRVESFVSLLYLDGVFTNEQYQALMEKIKEGRQVDNMYDLVKYLVAKREGKPWTKTEEALRFRDEMKRFVAKVKEHLKQEDFLFLDPTTY
jgi:hypothetical protein